ncbi:HAD hydrolase-like protein [uncultured Corynebacterium sp.]|uniref:HAD hydrolase-like protein n=1 Tax=uncultured Corynebacterium sp. TaxID=159447 RepID=UPI0025F1D337|nr:HAD hydrolase-like protein [uncultured Corynebacterium sp.]
MTAQPKKTLLFDLDGTLIDSFPGIRESFLHTLNTLGWEIPPEERINRVPGPPMEETLRSLGMSPELAQQGLQIYLERYGETGWENSTEFPGMRNLLLRLKDEGYRICTATSKGEYFAEKTLRKYEMYDLLDFMGAAQEDGTRRDKASVIRHVIDNVNLTENDPNLDHVLMIGDRSHDIEGAAAFGVDCVAVTWGYGTPEEWSHAKYTVTTAEELERIIHDWT